METETNAATRTGEVVAVCISGGGIPKLPQDACAVGVRGLAGDAHNHDKHHNPERAVCLQDLEMLETLRGEGFPLTPGAAGENVTLNGVNINAARGGDKLHFSGGLVIQLVEPRKPCYVLDAIDPKLKDALVGRCGFMARVLTPATLRPGETVRLNAGEGAS